MLVGRHQHLRRRQHHVHCLSQREPAAAPGEPAATLARQQNRIVIDVRTPEEFAAGHVEGAENIDIQNAAFDSQIAALDKNATYVVYCRSGNRSATAATAMRTSGLDVVDGGAFTTMTAAGWPAA
jgi:rhodanese-related sulfurtransferase